MNHVNLVQSGSCDSMRMPYSHGRTRLTHMLALTCLLHGTAAFTSMQVHLCAACTRPSSSRASTSSSRSSSSLSSSPNARRSYPRQQEWLGRRLAPYISAFRVEEHHQHQELGERRDDACTNRRRKTRSSPLLSSAVRPDTTSSAESFHGNKNGVRNNNNDDGNNSNNGRFKENRGRRLTLSASSEGVEEGDAAGVAVGGGGGGEGGGGEQEEAKKTRAEKKKGGKSKSILGKAGDAAKATFNAVMAAGTFASLLLAAQTLWELQGTPLTLSNAVPTLSKLLPLTGIGVFGAAQLVGLVARVTRVIVTLPIMLSGTWVILQNAPKLLPNGSDFRGAGSLAAILATPEVLEAAAVVALLGGVVIWALNFASGAIGSLGSVMDGRSDSSAEDDEFT